MSTQERLEMVEIRLREWCQTKVDLLTPFEIAEYRVLCDELNLIRNGDNYESHNR